MSETPEVAAALALYEAARVARRFRDSMKVRSAAHTAADRIYAELLDLARRRHLGELYDPAVFATEESLKAQIAEREDTP